MKEESMEEVLARLEERRRALFLDQKRSAALARKRKEARRGGFPVVRVVHPDLGTMDLRAESKCDAVNTAARIWGVPFVAISRETEVWRITCDAVNTAARIWGVPFVAISRETEVWRITKEEKDT